MAEYENPPFGLAKADDKNKELKEKIIEIDSENGDLKNKLKNCRGWNAKLQESLLDSLPFLASYPHGDAIKTYVKAKQVLGVIEVVDIPDLKDEQNKIQDLEVVIETLKEERKMWSQHTVDALKERDIYLSLLNEQMIRPALAAEKEKTVDIKPDDSWRAAPWRQACEKCESLEAKLVKCQQNKYWYSNEASEVWAKFRKAEREIQRLEAKAIEVDNTLDRFMEDNSTLEAEVAELKRTIKARDNECNTEHYMALNCCVDDTVMLQKVLKNVYKLWLDGDWYNDKVWNEVAEAIKPRYSNFNTQKPRMLEKELKKLRKAIEKYFGEKESGRL